MNFSDFKGLYFHLWFITFPITFFLLRVLVFELLDIFLNSRKIDKALLYSDNLDVNSLEKDFLSSRQKQVLVGKPYLSDMLTQMEFKKRVKNSNYTIRNGVVYFPESDDRISLKKNKKSRKFTSRDIYKTNNSEVEDIIIAKKLSDLFKIH